MIVYNRNYANDLLEMPDCFGLQGKCELALGELALGFFLTTAAKPAYFHDGDWIRFSSPLLCCRKSRDLPPLVGPFIL